MKRRLALLGATLALAGCGGGDDRPPRLDHPPRLGGGPQLPASSVWRQLATDHDRDRLRRAREGFVTGLARARASDPAAVAAQGVLFDPDVALDRPLLPPGRYRCRLFKLGANGTAAREFLMLPDAECQVQLRMGVTVLAALDGTQRLVGSLFADTSVRGIFLGTLVLGDESTPLAYGVDDTRDIAGTVERVAERRWRVVMPYPAFQSLTDVLELTPL